MLTDMMVRQAKATGKPYTIADFDGLSLFVYANGAKAWHFRYTWMGQRARISLGSYPELSLREARELRDEARSLVPRLNEFEGLISRGHSTGRRIGNCSQGTSSRTERATPGWRWMKPCCSRVLSMLCTVGDVVRKKCCMSRSAGACRWMVVYA